MGKNFKDVRNVLNMKKIVATGLLAGTLFGGTSAFAAGPTQTHEATQSIDQKNASHGWAILQNQGISDVGVQLQNANEKRCKKIFTISKFNT